MAESKIHVRVSADPVDAGEALAFVSDPSCGGSCLFLGTARETSDSGAAVTGLRYEAHAELAAGRLRSIAEEILQRWPVAKVALVHRTGDLAIGEVAVAVACSSPHRSEAFEACRHGIERIKVEAPIWKKESFVDGGSAWARVP